MRAGICPRNSFVVMLVCCCGIPHVVFLTFHLGPTSAHVLRHMGWKKKKLSIFQPMHPFRHHAWISVSKHRALRAKVDEAIQGRRCAVNIYPIILPPGLQNRQSAELLSIFPHLLGERNLREAAYFSIKALDKAENKHGHKVSTESSINVILSNMNKLDLMKRSSVYNKWIESEVA